MTIDLSRTGAVSEERAAEQIAEVTRVYAIKSGATRTTSAPKVIYLQYSAHENDYLKDYSDGITWCADKANSDDVEYIRADIHEAIEKEVGRLRELVAEIIPLIPISTQDSTIGWYQRITDKRKAVIERARSLLSPTPTERADK